MVVKDTRVTKRNILVARTTHYLSASHIVQMGDTDSALIRIYTGSGRSETRPLPGCELKCLCLLSAVADPFPLAGTLINHSNEKQMSLCYRDTSS